MNLHACLGASRALSFKYLWQRRMFDKSRRKKHSSGVKCNSQILCPVGCTPYIFCKHCNLEGTSTVRAKEKSCRILTMVYDSLIYNSFLGLRLSSNFLQSTKFRKPAVIRLQVREAPNLVDPLDRGNDQSCIRGVLQPRCVPCLKTYPSRLPKRPVSLKTRRWKMKK